MKASSIDFNFSRRVIIGFSDSVTVAFNNSNSAACLAVENCDVN